MKAAKLAGPATLAAGGALLFVALFFGDGPSDGRLFWIGAFAVLARGRRSGRRVPVPRGGRASSACALLAALAAWVGLTMAWSIAPDRSWAAFDRILVYRAFAALGLLGDAGAAAGADGRRRPRAAARARARLGAARQGDPVALPGRRARRAAYGIRSATGTRSRCAAATAVPLGLWLASARGTRAVARAAARAARLPGGAGRRAHLLARRHRGRRARGARLARALARPARVAAGPGRSHAGRRRSSRSGSPSRGPALTDDLQPYADRVNDGAWFGWLPASARRVVAVAAASGSPGSRSPTTDAASDATGSGVSPGSALAAVAVVLVAQGRRGPGRVPRHRWQGGLAEPDPARRAQLEQPLALVAGGVDALEGCAARAARARHVRDRAAGHPRRLDHDDRAAQPRAAVPQPRPGSSASCSSSASSAAGDRGRGRAVRRLEPSERAAAAALAIGLGAYVLHALVDIDWEFVAVTAPAFFVLGALLGLGARRRARVSRAGSRRCRGRDRRSSIRSSRRTRRRASSTPRTRSSRPTAHRAALSDGRVGALAEPALDRPAAGARRRRGGACTTRRAALR